MSNLIPSQKNIRGKQYKFFGAFWYKDAAEGRAKRLSKDAMDRPFMHTHITRYDSSKYMLPLNLGEVSPEARRIGLGRYGRVTNNIYVVWAREAYDKNYSEYKYVK
jgi:hypothetical protein